MNDRQTPDPARTPDHFAEPARPQDAPSRPAVDNDHLAPVEAHAPRHRWGQRPNEQRWLGIAVLGFIALLVGAALILEYALGGLMSAWMAGLRGHG